MHTSLNLFAQRISKLSIRSSLHTDSTLSADEASKNPPPPIPYGTPKPRVDRSVISLPVPGSFVDLYKNDGSPREVQTNQSSIIARRKQSEIPLSCHPPFEQSWIEVQPLRPHSVKTRTDLRPDHQHSSINDQGPADNDAYNKPSRATSSPYNGILLPSPPLPPSAPISRTSERRKMPYTKSPRARLPATTLSNNVEQPMAPLTPRHHKDLIRCFTDSPRSSGAGTTPEQSPSVDNSPNRNSIPLPATLRDRWANRKSSHVILADTSLQLKVFSELGVELDEVLSLYTPREMSYFGR
ncbi:hypothetical protein M436DRAFT_77534 [Aureobasidium namibiae CBS 147.97]|uniref:Uncharacterized protein n=1 Tax=Aureobasidium namibiae CBS 147.97 TaxID=1043004 RepID=A0A074X6K4_9PEZI|nr:uncharacterized protein M436DRAFT_77534 [Aureobasidium namibiae CBS 147.97]KEQ77662.1 hypothetical protein M436DRAFT_77534 [Aureobasidium namibiae CBS 147.97]